MDTQRLERQLPGLRNFARELQIHDPNQFAAVKKLPEWYGEQAAEIHVPPGGPYELCLALDKIETSGVEKPLDRISIASGKHNIRIFYETKKENSIASVILDGEVALTESRPKDWEPRAGSSGGMQFSTSKQYNHPAPWILFRRRFMTVSGPSSSQIASGPTLGLLVWIQKTGS